MARQGDSQLALSTPALLTDQYLSQRGLHGLSTSAARNVLSLPDHAQDFGICQIFHIDTYYSVCLSFDLPFPADSRHFLSISDSILFHLMLNLSVVRKFLCSVSIITSDNTIDGILLIFIQDCLLT